MSTAKYDRLKAVAEERYNDKAYCGVLALAVFADVSYGKAQAALRRAGRKDRRGTSLTMFMDASSELGVSCMLEKLDSPITVNKIARDNVGPVVYATSTHMLGAIDTIVHDYTRGGRHRVTHVIRPVLPAQEAAAA